MSMPIARVLSINVNDYRKRARLEKKRETGQKFVDRDLDVFLDRKILSEDDEVVRLHEEEDRKKTKINSCRVSFKKIIKVVKCEEITGTKQYFVVD